MANRRGYASAFGMAAAALVATAAGRFVFAQSGKSANPAAEIAAAAAD